MNNMSSQMPLVLGMSPSTNDGYNHRAFHDDAEATKRLAATLDAEGNSAQLHALAFFVNLNREGRRPRGRGSVTFDAAEGSETLTQLNNGNFLHDAVIIALGSAVASCFCDWIGADAPAKGEPVVLVHSTDHWECAFAWVDHPSALQFQRGLDGWAMLRRVLRDATGLEPLGHGLSVEGLNSQARIEWLENELAEFRQIELEQEEQRVIDEDAEWDDRHFPPDLVQEQSDRDFEAIWTWYEREDDPDEEPYD